MKGKLIEFPEPVLDALAEYKKQTGISASDYIRDATCRRMIVDGVIRIKTITIDVEQKGNGKKIQEIINAPPEAIKFCDGDKCEVDPRGMKSC